MNIDEIMQEVQASGNPIGVLRGYLAFLDPENDKELFEELIKEYNNLKDEKK